VVGGGSETYRATLRGVSGGRRGGVVMPGIATKAAITTTTTTTQSAESVKESTVLPQTKQKVETSQTHQDQTLGNSQKEDMKGKDEKENDKAAVFCSAVSAYVYMFFILRKFSVNSPIVGCQIHHRQQ
jgi:hypothetical protein